MAIEADFHPKTPGITVICAIRYAKYMYSMLYDVYALVLWPVVTALPSVVGLLIKGSYRRFLWVGGVLRYYCVNQR